MRLAVPASILMLLLLMPALVGAQAAAGEEGGMEVEQAAAEAAAAEQEARSRQLEAAVLAQRHDLLLRQRQQLEQQLAHYQHLQVQGQQQGQGQGQGHGQPAHPPGNIGGAPSTAAGAAASGVRRVGAPGRGPALLETERDKQIRLGLLTPFEALQGFDMRLTSSHSSSGPQQGPARAPTAAAPPAAAARGAASKPPRPGLGLLPAVAQAAPSLQQQQPQQQQEGLADPQVRSASTTPQRPGLSDGEAAAGAGAAEQGDPYGDLFSSESGDEGPAPDAPEGAVEQEEGVEWMSEDGLGQEEGQEEEEEEEEGELVGRSGQTLRQILASTTAKTKALVASRPTTQLLAPHEVRGQRATGAGVRLEQRNTSGDGVWDSSRCTVQSVQGLCAWVV